MIEKIKILNRICLLFIVCSIMLSSAIVASAADATPTYNVTIDASPIAGDVHAGNSYVYNITVNNTGNTIGNYAISVIDSDITNFNASVLGNTTMEINNGSSAKTTLTVSAKTGVTAGTVDITTINVTSVENPIYTNSTQVRTTVNMTKHDFGNQKCSDCHADSHKAVGKLPQSAPSGAAQRQGAVQSANVGTLNIATTSVVGNITLVTGMGQDWYQQGIYGPDGGLGGGGVHYPLSISWGWTFFDENPPSGFIIPPEKVIQRNNIYALLLDDGNNSTPITGATVVANVTYWIYDNINYTSNVVPTSLVEDPTRKGFYSGRFDFHGGTTYAGYTMRDCDGCHSSMYGAQAAGIGYFPGNYTVSIRADADGKTNTADRSFDVTPWGCEDCHGSGNQHRASADMKSACYICHSVNTIAGMSDAGNPHQIAAHRSINCIDCHTGKSINSQTFNGVTFTSGGLNGNVPQYNYDTIQLNKGTHSTMACTDCHNSLSLPTPQGGHSSYSVSGIVNNYDPSFAGIKQFQDYYVINVDSASSLNITLDWEGTANLGFYLYPPGFNPKNDIVPAYYNGATPTNKPEVYNSDSPTTGQWILQVYGYDLRYDFPGWNTWGGVLQPPINYTITSTFPIQMKDLPSTPECNSCHNTGATGGAYTKDIIPNWNPGFAHTDTNGDGTLDIQCRMCHNSMHDIVIKTCQNCHTTAPTNHPVQNPAFTQYTPTQCLGCHGDPHNISIKGSGDCVACHDVTVGAAPALINASAMNTADSIHKDLNKDAVLIATSNPENKKCWVCHGNGTEPTNHPDNYKTPAVCVDCHAGSNTNFTPSNTILKVSEHYWNGGTIKTAGVSSCYQCHNKSEMMIFANSPDSGTGAVYGGANGGNNSTSHYGKKRGDLVSMLDTRPYCDYCHNSTTSPSTSFFDVFVDINNRSIQNHSAYGTNPKCQDCHNSGRIHNSTLTFPALTLPNSTFCLTCHGPGGTASIKDKSKHNNTVDCSVCHLSTGKDIHPIGYLNNTGAFTQNRSDGVKCDYCHETGRYSAPAVGKVQHSTNPSNGSLWNAGRPSAFWDGNNPPTECNYCHGNSKHNVSALGKPNLFDGTNIVNAFGDWCGTCHYQVNGQYNNMIGVMNPLIAPEISHNSTYGNYVTASDGTGYFNHSLTSYNDNDCKGCHYNGMPPNLTTLMHKVEIGGTSCLGCHSNPGTDYFIDTTNMGKHKNVSTSEGVGIVSDNDCKGCHFDVLRIDQMQVGYANKTNTYFCDDCHKTGGRNPAQYNNISVSLRVDTLQHANSSCQTCHIAGDKLPRPLPATYKFHNGSSRPLGTAYDNVNNMARNCYSCHYRSDGAQYPADSATIGLNSPPFNAPGEDHRCDLACHAANPGNIRPPLTGSGDACSHCHGTAVTHNVAYGNHYVPTDTGRINEPMFFMYGVGIAPSTVNVGQLATVSATVKHWYVQIAKAQYRIMNSANTVVIRDWAGMNASDGLFNNRIEGITANIDTTGLATGTYNVQVKGMASGNWGGAINHDPSKPYYPDNGVWTGTATVKLNVTSIATMSNVIIDPASPSVGQVINITVQINNPGAAFNGRVEGNVWAPSGAGTYLGYKDILIPTGVSTVMLCCTYGSSTYKTSESGTHYYDIFLENRDLGQTWQNPTDSKIHIPFGVSICSPAPVFSDVLCGYWAYSPIMALYGDHIVGGYPDGTFRPENSITRAEFAAIITRSRNLTYTGGLSDFPDVPPSYWAYSNIMAANQAGITVGYPDGTFRPENLVTRAEISAMITNARGWIYTGGLSDFPDVPPSHWAYQAVMAVKQKGVIGGYPDGTFRPDNSATRAEASAMTRNMMTVP